MLTRREFSRNAVATAAGLALSSTANSYARILGSNDRVNVAVVGLNSRAYAHLSSLKANQAACNITHVVDVDSKILAKYAAAAEKEMGAAPKTDKDFRKMLEQKDVDAITIATPDHWHTPLALYGLKANKHVYVEKPCSQNLHEADLLIAAQKKYGKVVVMGNQQHSSDYTRDMVQQVQGGNLIGRAYYAKTWYTNLRKSIGVGKPIPVPETLDWDLWQGPAPRREYKDNIHPYNWHWFHVWGTGEALNNGTHELDVARWFMDVKFPKRVSVAGGRYHFKDDWEFYDTLNASFEYDDKLIEWECRCCNDMPIYGRERGTAVYGTEGTVIIDRDGYEIHDLKGKMVKEWKVPKSGHTSSTDTVGRDGMTDVHFKNWLDCIRDSSTKQDQPIEDAARSVGTLLMANIAYDLKKELHVNPDTGAFINDPTATAKRRRTYEKGWEPTV
jgi:predicted dehydrogenase